MAISIPPSDCLDSIYWTLSSTGCYSIKSGYATAFSKLWALKASSKDRLRLESSSVLFCKQRLWSLPISGKWRLFLWKILTNTLPLGSEAMKRNLDWNYFCVNCSSSTQFETPEHLFRDCPLASRIWMGSQLGINSHSGGHVNLQKWIINWISLFLKKEQSCYLISFFVSGLWRIWCIRNALKFRSSPVDLYSSMSLLSLDASLNIDAEHQYMLSQQRRLNHDQDDLSEMERIRNFFPHFLIGSAGCSDYIRVKCDAAWKPSFQAAAGWILKSSSGEVIYRGQAKFWASSAFQAEANALYLALSDALSKGFTHIDASSDCLNLVYQVAGLQAKTQDAVSILCCICNLLVCFHCFAISFCPRTLNRTTHAIAKCAIA
ncbi:uncharacterized protein LOC141637179 [Silene latifolia]|uniref:uncharacterized protein LOC141637179 n=1 Tax=Silene latifolia TaxID=37657 RepID=UPI003D76FF0B